MHSVHRSSYVFIVILIFGYYIDLTSSYPHIGYCHYSATESNDSSNSNTALTFVCSNNQANNSNVHGRTFDGWLACKSQYGNGKKPIDTINFRVCKFDELRNDLFATYPTAHTLNATNIGLKSLQSINFGHSNALRTVILSHNAIRDIPANLFHESVEITYIDLSYNVIKTVHSSAFRHENFVEYLNLSFNRIVELKPELLHRFHRLEYLHLAGNRLVKIESGSFLRCPDLIKIDLSNNSIESFNGAAAFALENRVEMLNLSFNNITKIASNSFQRLRHLKWLLLSNNNIQNMTRIALNSQTTVNQIDLSHNQIQRIDFDVNVVTMNLSHNRITTADDVKKMLYSLVNLVHLNLSSNQITSLLPNTFQNAQHLQHLDLSCNSIREISVQTFVNLVHLEYLTLTGNRLTKIQAGTFSTLRHLKTLDISNNALKAVNVNILPLQPNQMELMCVDLERVELQGFHSIVEIADVGCQRIESKITDPSTNDKEFHSDKNVKFEAVDGYRLGMQVFLIGAIVLGINIMILAWLNSQKINATADSRTMWCFLVALKKNTSTRSTRQSESCRYSNIHCMNLPNNGCY